MTKLHGVILPTVLALASLSACTVGHDYSSPGNDPWVDHSPTPRTYEVPGPPPPGYYYYDCD